MSTHETFLRATNTVAGDAGHRQKLDKAMGTYQAKVAEMRTQQWGDHEAARTYAQAVKAYTLARLPQLLEQFERGITARGATVHWAADAAAARTLILEIAQKAQAKQVVKSKSMTTEEIDLNETLEHAGIKVWETDLGEFIVQLAGEKPYHIVTPAMHKSRAEVGELFHAKLGEPLTHNPEELAMMARKHLRSAYVTAEVGITGANFLIADDGAAVVCENEGNARLSLSCPPVHIVIAGIEKVLPRLADLAHFLPLLATSGTGQQLTCYTSLIRGPRAPMEVDGPRELHVILLDNGRSTLYAKPTHRVALSCIRCGACLNACPVYHTVGGHSYGTTYQGPIGAVITAPMRGQREWQHLAQASSLCGACTSVCPVRIPLHQLLLENRHQAEQIHAGSRFWRHAMGGYAATMGSRGKLQAARTAYRLAQGAHLLPLPAALAEFLPPLPAKTFAQQWAEQERQHPQTKAGANGGPS